MQGAGKDLDKALLVSDIQRTRCGHPEKIRRILMLPWRRTKLKLYAD
jgi:hypothetical protein